MSGITTRIDCEPVWGVPAMPIKRNCRLAVVLMVLVGLLLTSRHAIAVQKKFAAPSLSGGMGWINTSKPLNMRALRGKVVLLDFWTYCCINCMHILPTLKQLEEKYPNELVVIGVHSAKFRTERDLENIRRAVLRYEISHPVLNDGRQAVWRRWNVNRWPTLFLVDPEGMVWSWQSGETPFEAIDRDIAQIIRIHRNKGTLNEQPIHFELDRSRLKPTPLLFPGKVIIDADNEQVYIADSGHHRIVVAGFDGKLLGTIGSGLAGQADGDFSTSSFRDPQGMVLSGNTLYIADNLNHLVRAADVSTGQVTTLAGTGRMLPSYKTLTQYSTTPRQYALSNPWDLALIGSKLFIAMAGTHQIAVLDLAGNGIGVFSGTGVEDIQDGQRTMAAQIVEEANRKADQVAGNAMIALRDSNQIEATAKAMKNIIEGYGDEYLVPGHSLLDDLAEEYSHKEAGIELKAARERVRKMVSSEQAAACDYAEKGRKKTAVDFVLDAFDGKVDVILSKV